MSDEDLRELERAFKASGSVEDEAKWLMARVRAGEVTREALAVLGFFGHAAARAAVGDVEPPAWEQEDAQIWASRLRSMNKEWLVRSTIALARFCMPNWRAAHPDDLRPPKALEAAEAWVLCPCEAHRQAAKDAADAIHGAVVNAIPDHVQAWEESEEDEDELAALPPGRLRLSAAEADRFYASHVAAEVAGATAKAASSTMLVAAGTAFYDGVRHLAPSPRGRNAGKVSYAEMRRLVRELLVPWVLGPEDPLRAGVTAAPVAPLTEAERAMIVALVPAIGRNAAAVAATLRAASNAEACSELARHLQG